MIKCLIDTKVEAELFSFHDLTEQDEQQFEDALKIGEIIDVNSKIARKAGELRKISRNIYNKKLKLPDALVAATAMEHSATLITRNENDFNHLLNHGLSLYNPFK
ncbi:MAG: type II toxin-antitoxin system VapC family toxin [Bacillota bacterium]